VDICGRRLEIYRSDGWEFESLRACMQYPTKAEVSLVRVLRSTTRWAAFLVVFLVEIRFRAANSSFALTFESLFPAKTHNACHVLGWDPLRPSRPSGFRTARNQRFEAP
jgi:hypothetical protein